MCRGVSSYSKLVVVSNSFFDPMNYSPPVSSIHRISQTRILELLYWITISFSRGSSQFRDRIQVSCIGRGILYQWATMDFPTLGYSCWMTQTPPRRLRRCISELSAQGTKEGTCTLQVPAPMTDGIPIYTCSSPRMLSACICMWVTWIPLSGPRSGVEEALGQREEVRGVTCRPVLSGCMYMKMLAAMHITWSKWCASLGFQSSHLFWEWDELPAGKWENETGAGRQPMNGALSRLLSL